MHKYSDYEYNREQANIHDEIAWFLNGHTLSELLKIITDIVEYKETHNEI